MRKNDIYHKRVRDVMVTHVVSVDPRDKASDALKLMMENRVTALPVIDGHDRCVGVISSSDMLQLADELGGELEALQTSQGLAHEMLLEQLERTGFSAQTVQEVMTHTPVSIDPEASLVAAAGEMLRSRVHRLPVTNKSRKLVGIISTMDILRALAESDE